MVRTAETAVMVAGAASAALEPGVLDDALARHLLLRAQGALQKWPEGFLGFSATIRCREGARVVSGEVRVFAGGRVEIALPCPDLRAWAEATLRAIACARTVVPRRTQIQAWDVVTGSAIDAADVEDDHCRVDHVWLPARRHAVLTIGEARRVLGLELEGHVVLSRWT